MIFYMNSNTETAGVSSSKASGNPVSALHQTTMYGCSAQQAWDLFGSYMSGARSGYVGVVYTRPLESAAQKALESSAKALGYGTDACTYINCAELDESSLMAALEGVDPVVMVVCDADAARAIEKSYGCTLPLGTPARVFGRSTVTFKDFGALMATDESKQRAWALLRQLPKFGEV